MKRMAFVAVACVLSIACQRPAERSADAAAPSPSATPATRAPGEALPAEAPAGAPVAASEPAARAAAQKAPARSGSAPAAPVAAPAEPEPTPTPKPAPTPKPRIVPSGTALAIVLEQELSTKTAKAEDPVVASLAEDVSVDGEVLLPKGAEVHGHVVSSVRSGRTKGRARIVVAFNEVRVNSRSYTIDATGFDVTAGSSKGKDAKIAGGSAAAGAIIGGIAGGGSGALKGGLIGGAVGGGAVLATRGVEVELKAGTPYKIELKKSLHVR
jgi:type IV secretory pathway VirB10-like protein